MTYEAIKEMFLLVQKDVIICTLRFCGQPCCQVPDRWISQRRCLGYFFLVAGTKYVTEAAQGRECLFCHSSRVQCIIEKKS